MPPWVLYFWRSSALLDDLFKQHYAMYDTSHLPNYIAGFLLFISGASGIALLVKAWIDNVPQATANILWPIFIGAACVGLLLNHSASHSEQVFLGLLGGAAGLSLVIRAIFDMAHKPGIATLNSLFIVSIGATLLLYFLPVFATPPPQTTPDSSPNIDFTVKP